jgi:undecaprenyl-diphosphatase
MDAVVQLDHAIFRAINGLQGSPSLDTFFLWATDLGTAWFSAIPLAIIVFVRHRRAWRAVLAGTLLGLGVGGLNYLIKMWVDRPRPPVVLPETRVVGPLLTLYSFPSGHTAMAFIIFALLFRLDRPLAWTWLPLALLIAFSRMYLGVHFPSDVLAGGVVGFFPTYYLSRYLPGRTRV